MKKIKEIALDLKETYLTEYKKWCDENPGSIMNGYITKVDAMEKASYCTNIDEINAMRKYYEIAYRSAKGPNGFLFSLQAMEKLLGEVIEHNWLNEDDDDFYSGII